MLPVIQLEDDSEDALRALARAGAETGFFLLETTLITRPMLSALEDAMRRFFALPLTEKMRAAKQNFVAENTNRYRGYFPAEPGLDTFKEGFEFGTSGAAARFTTHPFYEPNAWPAVGWSDSDQALFESYRDACFGIGMRLLARFGKIFNRPPEHLTTLFQDSISTMRIMHYPAGGSRGYATPSHCDSGFITVLHQDRQGGLEVELNGVWQDVPPAPGRLVINFGRLFEAWTDGFVQATLHRVRAPLTSRYSAAFFFEPGYEANIVSLKEGRAIGTYGQLLRQNMAGFREYDGFLGSLPSS